MALSTDELLEKAVEHQRESKYVEFKSRFDPASKKSWCDLVKEVVALANTKGGVVVIGLADDASPSGFDSEKVLKLDPAKVTDSVHKYTGYQLTEFTMHECQKDGHTLCAIVVEPVRVPLVFEKPGGYATDDGDYREAFPAGMVYFRHGAKSEPATRDDLRAAIERRLEEERDRWISSVERVVKSEPGSEVAVLPPEVTQTRSEEGTPIRIVDDPDAPAFHVVSPDQTHPYLFTEVVSELNRRLPDHTSINRHDFLSVRAAHNLLESADFSYRPEHGSPQYSDSLITWVMKQYKRNEDFFDEARATYREMRQG